MIGTGSVLGCAELKFCPLTVAPMVFTCTRGSLQDPDQLSDHMDDDAESTEGLGPLLEDYRRKKQAKQQKLQKDADQAGRPWSAPASSPSCAAIRRRSESAKLLRKHPHGASDIALACISSWGCSIQSSC